MIEPWMQIVMFVVTVILGGIAIFYSYKEYHTKINNKDYVIQSLIHETAIISNVVTSVYQQIEELPNREHAKINIGESARFFDNSCKRISEIRENMYGVLTNRQFDLFLNFTRESESFLIDTLGLTNQKINDKRPFLEADITKMANISESIQKEFYNYFPYGRYLSFTRHIPDMRKFIKK